MAYFDRESDTICALATGAGRSGIAVIRVSGPDSYHQCKQLCSFLPERPESHRLYHGILKSASHETSIDEVLVSYFAQGRSYTGEETCEISCHGSPSIASQILNELVSIGCRVANRGEFTFRAYMNGRIDLVQAESVLALIESSNKKASRLALEQLGGQLSDLFENLEVEIVWILSRIEAAIDFSTEGIEIIDGQEIAGRLKNLIQTCDQLINSYKIGRILTDGIRIAIAGKPNAGKSSLLNALTLSDRAIVSSIPGTTRDTIESTLKIGGIQAQLVDTAGIRESGDEIERMGIARSLEEIKKADVTLGVIDSAAEDVEQEVLRLGSMTENLILVFNKSDLVKRPGKFNGVHVSCKTGEGIQELKEQLEARFSNESFDENNVIIHARHKEHLEKVKTHLGRAMVAFEELSPEFSCLDLRGALDNIGKILGRELSEDVIGQIFKDFCIGK